MLLWGKLHVHEPRRPYPADLAPRHRTPGALSDRVGRGDRARARAGHRHGHLGQRPQRDRRARRLLCGLSRARGVVRRARSDRAGPTSPTPRRLSTSARSRNGRSPTASSRSIPGATAWREDFARRDRRGHRHPSDHRDHQGAARPARDSATRRPGGSKVDGEIVQPTGDISVTKAAIDPVWYLPGIAERFGIERRQAAPHPVRADRRHVIPNWSRGPISACSCRRSAA